MRREQFTFYRSFYEAIKILPKKEQTLVLLAICAYALDGEEPNLTGTAGAIFTLVRPTLDASKRKAENGSAGGKAGKQTGSKQKANGKQPASEKEGEKEKEGEIENECYSAAVTGYGPDLQSAFESWLTYKTEKRQAYKPEGLRNLVSEIRNQAAKHGEQAVADLIRTCMASNWQGIIFDRLKGKEPQKGQPAQGRKSWSDVAAEMEAGV